MRKRIIMNNYDIIRFVISYLTMIPVVILYYAPLKNHLKYSVKKTAVCFAAAYIFLSPFCYLIRVNLSYSHGMLSLPLLFVFFLILQFFLDYRETNLTVSFAVYVTVCSLFTSLTNFTIFTDAILHPSSVLLNFSIEAAVLRIVLYLLFTIILIKTFSVQGSYLTDNLSDRRTWFKASIISSVFLIYSMMNTLNYYQTLHTNRVFSAYVSSLVLILILQALFLIIFNATVTYVLKQGEKNEKYRILQMEEKQFISQQRFIENDAKARHDFRHIIRTLKIMLDEKNYEEMGELLNSYASNLMSNEFKKYCNDNALNATINHYVDIAGKNKTKTDIRISLPDEIFIKTSDLCSIIGNIMENALEACKEIPPEDRSIRLYIRNNSDSEIYIAAENFFNGKILKKGEQFISTKRNGKAIGLLSVATTAEKYGGAARFNFNDRKFFSDVFLKNVPDR